MLLDTQIIIKKIYCQVDLIKWLYFEACRVFLNKIQVISMIVLLGFGCGKPTSTGACLPAMCKGGYCLSVVYSSNINYNSTHPMNLQKS